MDEQEIVRVIVNHDLALGLLATRTTPVILRAANYITSRI